MQLKERMDAIYRDLGVDEIPWNTDAPPGVLLDLLDEGRIRPCDAVDLGCGAGNHVVWLASIGFRMTGIDLSSEAIDRARRLAGERGVSCRFEVRNMAGDVCEEHDAAFDLAYDWKVLHHVFPEHRARWAENVRRLLCPRGVYVSVCFSDVEPTGFEGSGKYRDTPLGTTLYLSSEDEIRETFEPFFVIEELATVVVAGKTQPHTAVKALMTKRG